MSLPILYIRSSSYNKWDMCPQDYFISYVLGRPGLSGKKADKGTITHKVLEILAKIKKGRQDSLIQINDSIVGSLDINNTVSYTDIQNITTDVYKFYTNKYDYHNWIQEDLSDCFDWVIATIEHNDGMYHPLFQNIVTPEFSFDIEIKKPWASQTINGVSHYLRLKGTIDLVIKSNDNSYYEMIDYKTGRRWDWAKNCVKDEEKLRNDPQLLLYFYVLSTLFPNINTFLVTIFFINDGGPFPVFMSKDQLPQIEEMIKQRYNTIMSTEYIQLNKSWKCKSFCWHGRNSFCNSNIKQMEDKTICSQIEYETQRKGINNVIKEYTRPGFVVDEYQSPGE